MDWEHLLKTDFSKLEKTISEPITKIVRLKKGERRDAAVLFLDLKGFTALSTTVDPELLIEIINNTFVLFTRVIEKYRGYVDKYEGDAIMAVFGGRKAAETDTENAVRAALEMYDVQSRINKILKIESKSLSMRIGINFGNVVVTDVGYGDSKDETIYGNAVNLAARLEQACPPESICITEKTKEIIDHCFNCSFLEKSKLKGIPETFNLWTVESLQEQQVEKWDRKDIFRETLLIGREHECESIFNVYDNLIKNRNINCDHAFVLISGSAGIGKSRLGFEVVNSLKSKYGHIISCKGFGVSYLPPVLNLITEFCRDFIGKYDKEISKVTLNRALNDLNKDLESLDLLEIEPLIGYILKIPYQDERLEILKGDDLVKELSSAFCLLLTAITQKSNYPPIFIFDDLQWKDEFSQKILFFIFMNLPVKNPALFLLINRGNDLIISESINTQKTLFIELEPLKIENISKVIKGLVSNFSFDEDFLNLIVDKSGGNPFFIEELIRYLIMNEIIIEKDNSFKIAYKPEDIDPPNSLKSLILSRVDCLKPRQKELIQAASVIGREFYIQVITEISSLVDRLSSDTIKNDLTVAEEMKYILETSKSKQAGFIFRDILTHETIYNTLLFSNRKILHRLVADSLAELKEDDYIVGKHYYNSDQPEKAIPFLKRSFLHCKTINAADIAYKQAVWLYELESDLIWKLEQARLSEITGNWNDSKDICEELIEDEKLKPDVLLVRGKIKLGQAESQEAEQDLLESARLFQEVGNLSGTMESIRIAAKLYLNRQQFSKAKQMYLQVLKFVEKSNDNIALSRLKTNLGIIAESENNYEEAEKLHREALQFVQKDKLIRSAALGNLANLYWRKGDMEKAIELYKEQSILCGSIPWKEGIANSSCNMGVCLLHLGNLEKAIEMLQKAENIYQMLGDKWGLVYALNNLTDIHLRYSRWYEAITLAERTAPIAKSIGDPEGLALVYSAMGDAYTKLKDSSKAFTSYNLAIEAVKEQENAYYLSYFYFARGQHQKDENLKNDDFSKAEKFANIAQRKEILGALEKIKKTKK